MYSKRPLWAFEIIRVDKSDKNRANNKPRRLHRRYATVVVLTPSSIGLLWIIDFFFSWSYNCVSTRARRSSWRPSLVWSGRRTACRRGRCPSAPEPNTRGANSPRPSARRDGDRPSCWTADSSPRGSASSARLGRGRRPLPWNRSRETRRRRCQPKTLFWDATSRRVLRCTVMEQLRFKRLGGGLFTPDTYRDVVTSLRGGAQWAKWHSPLQPPLIKTI